MANYTTFKNHRENAGGGGILKFTSKEVDTQGYATGDTFELFKVPKGFTPLAAYVQIKEASGEARTIDIGVTGGDVDGILDGVSLAGAAGTVVQTALGDDITGSTIFTAESTISALQVTGTAYAAGKFIVHLWGVA